MSGSGGSKTGVQQRAQEGLLLGSEGEAGVTWQRVERMGGLESYLGG